MVIVSVHSKSAGQPSQIWSITLLMPERGLPTQRAKLVNNLENPKFYAEKVIFNILNM